MTLDAALAYLHFVAIFVLAYFLVREYGALRRGSAGLDTNALVRIDIGYMVGAIVVLATGLARLLLGPKPLEFFTANPVFHAKLGVFVLVGLVSIAPTVAFLRWRRAASADAAFRVPDAQIRRMRLIVLAELHGLAAIPLLAVLMARGIGHS